MGTAVDDLPKYILYPLCGLGVSMLVWWAVIGHLCQKICVSEKTFHGVASIVMYMLQWTVMNPHLVKLIAITPSTELYLFLSAGYYMRSVFQRQSHIQVTYCIVSVFSILDLITYRKGGELAICYIFLTEVPDMLISLLLRFTCWEPAVAIADSICHVFFRVAIFGFLVFRSLLEKKLSEDIKLNIFIIHAFSYISLPRILADMFARIIGDKLRHYRQSNLFQHCCRTNLRTRKSRS